MAESESKSIIHRKARVGREDFDARAMSPSKALRLSLAKSADTLFDLPLTVSTVEQSSIASAAIPEKFGEDGLLILLDGAGGQRGAVKIDTQFIAALIEAQIIGDVREGEARPRSYTRTDAAMAAPFLEHVLKGFDTQLSDHSEGHIPFAMRFGDRIEDARVLGLALEGERFELFKVMVDLADGAKTGAISFLLPQRVVHRGESGSGANGDDIARDTLAKNALEATATLDAVIARVDLPLKDICALKPGMTLQLPPESLLETHLYAPPRHLVAEVRLGQLNGHRAVRFVSDDIADQPDDVSDMEPDYDLDVHTPQAEVLPAMPDLEPNGMDETAEANVSDTIDSVASDLSAELERPALAAES